MMLRNLMQGGSGNAWKGVVAVTLAGCGAAVAIVCSVMAMLVMYQRDE